MALHIVFSNRIETLQGLLMQELDSYPANPFEPQHVVVPGTAMSRYLQLAIAGDKGICANVEFSYLGRWLWELARIVDKSVPERSPVDPDVMAWLLLRRLKKGAFTAYPRLDTFIKNADDLMTFEFAESLAQVFDHYATYRPDWLTAWSNGDTVPDFKINPAAEEDERWQSEIWRSVSGELNLGNTHPLQTFLDAVTGRDHSRAESLLPRRAAIFAVPVIPPLYLQTICRLSGVMDVTFYMLNPCREYWFEIVPQKRLSYLQGIKKDAHREVGHQLLADWGRATQAAIDLIYEAAVEIQTPEDSFFSGPEGNSLLAQLQRSILDLEDLNPGGVQMTGDDRSIEIHCCHGAVRELEVLHNRLLEIFAADRTLKAGNVIVLTPDIDALAPAIEAVFGTVPKTHFIPYTIAGRAMASTNPYLQVLLELLDLLSSRMPASRVFDLLRQGPVARKFEMDDESLSRIRGWLGSSGMRWGLDRAHREEMRIPGDDRHTFRWGMDSLFLGLALPDPDAPMAGILPSDSLEGSRAETLGLLWMFIERLAHWRDRLKENQAAGAWQVIMNELLADFTSCDDNSRGDHDLVSRAVADLAENWHAANLTDTLSPRVVRAALVDADVRRRGAVPSGMVTFTSLSAMRGIGYRVVCLIGMNDGSYPGRDRPFEFDLIQYGKARRGDRQRRVEERGIFLDALLAARDALHISYTGRDQRNNAEMPPSVLLAQLIDYLVRAVAPADATAEELSDARSRLIVNHPLQPFSRRYFDASDQRLYSYVGQYAAALNGVKPDDGKGTTVQDISDEDDEDVPDMAPPFFDKFPNSRGRQAGEPQAVAMDELASFLNNPSKHFLQKQLQIRLTEADGIISDEEPLDVGFSQERGMAETVVEACLKQSRILDVEEALALLNASPEAPPQSVCAAYFSREWQKIAGLASRLLEATAEPKMDPYQAALSLSDGEESWQLGAGFSDLRPCGLVSYRCDELRGYDYLRAWIRHLVLCSSMPGGVKMQTRHFAFDEDLSFNEISGEEAREYLVSLLRLYSEGHSRPIPFFKKAAWEYVDGGGMKEASRKWSGGYSPEKDDIWHALAWRGIPDPLNEKFQEIAETVFRPMLEHRIVTSAPVAV